MTRWLLFAGTVVGTALMLGAIATAAEPHANPRFRVVFALVVLLVGFSLGLLLIAR